MWARLPLHPNRSPVSTARFNICVIHETVGIRLPVAAWLCGDNAARPGSAIHDLSTMEIGKPMAAATFYVAKRMAGVGYGKISEQFEAEIWPGVALSVADGSHGVSGAANIEAISTTYWCGQLACNGMGEQPF